MARRRTIRDAIEFYELHGHMGPYAIKGGEGASAPNPAPNPNPNPAPSPTPDPGGEGDPPDLGEAGKKALSAERAARKAAEEAAKKTAEELAAMRAAQAEAEAAKAAEEEEAAKKRGEFEKIAENRAQEITNLKTELVQVKADLAKADELLASVVAERAKALEELGDADLLAAYPKDASTLERIAWLDDPRTKAALTRAEEAKKVTDAQGKPRVPGTPNPADRNTPRTQADRERSMRRAARSYSG